MQTNKRAMRQAHHYINWQFTVGDALDTSTAKSDVTEDLLQRCYKSPSSDGRGMEWNGVEWRRVEGVESNGMEISLRSSVYS